MPFNKKVSGNILFWLTIVSGMLLPIVAFFAVDIFKGTKLLGDILRDVIDCYFKDFTDIGFMFWLFQSMAFLALAFLVKNKIQEKDNVISSPVIAYSEAIGAWLLMVTFSVIMNVNVLVSKSSTASIAYIFIPFYEIIMILIGYALGWCIGRIILWYKKVVSNNA